MHVVVDTHALLWYLAESPHLSPQAADEFRAIEEGKQIAVIPAIVILECLDVLEKKKVPLPFATILRAMSHSSNFVLSELGWDVILETKVVTGINDLHDRVIIATARLYNAPIISRDRIIADMYDKVIW